MLAVGCAPASRETPPGIDLGEATTDSLPAGWTGDLPDRLEVEGILGTYGSGPGQMAYPEGVAVDNLGRVFVADTGNNRVLRFDSAGVFLGEFGGFGFEEGRFDKPRDLFIGGTLSLLVLDGENARVVKYDLEGRLLGTVVDLASSEAQRELGLVRPGGLAGDTGGSLFVSDAGGDRVLGLDALGGGLRIIGGFGSQPGRFRHPSGLTVSARGTLLVADGGNTRVQALDAFGGFLRAWPLSGPTYSGRVSLAWLPGGRLAIAESDSSRVTVLSSEGRVIARLDRRGRQAGEIDRPAALAVDRSGRLYVADTQNHRVQVFRLVERRATPKR
jgi:tripartite motif-containing protein 71